MSINAASVAGLLPPPSSPVDHVRKGEVNPADPVFAALLAMLVGQGGLAGPAPVLEPGSLQPLGGTPAPGAIPLDVVQSIVPNEPAGVGRVSSPLSLAKPVSSPAGEQTGGQKIVEQTGGREIVELPADVGPTVAGEFAASLAVARSGEATYPAEVSPVLSAATGPVGTSISPITRIAESLSAAITAGWDPEAVADVPAAEVAPAEPSSEASEPTKVKDLRDTDAAEVVPELQSSEVPPGPQATGVASKDEVAEGRPESAVTGAPERVEDQDDPEIFQGAGATTQRPPVEAHMLTASVHPPEVTRAALLPERLLERVRGPITPERLMTAIADSVSVTEPGQYTVTLRLHPEHLGEMSLELHLKGREVQTVMEVAHPAAQRALEDQSDLLRQGLDQAGFMLSGLQVSTGHGGQTRDRRDQLNELLREQRRAKGGGAPLPVSAVRGQVPQVMSSRRAGRLDTIA